MDFTKSLRRLVRGQEVQVEEVWVGGVSTVPLGIFGLERYKNEQFIRGSTPVCHKIIDQSGTETVVEG